VDLTSHAELAVSLVNTAVDVDGEADQLGTTGAFRAFLDDYPDMRGPWTHHDLDALRMLRTELSAVFVAAAERDHAAAAERLNALLVQYPVRPVLVRHDRSGWHLHLDNSGSIADLTPSRVNRYCPRHAADKANVTAIRNHRGSAAGYPASTAVG
jgi:hypothetical protein